MRAARPKTLPWEREQGDQIASPEEDGKEKRKYKRRTVEFHEDIEKAIDILQEQLRLRSHTDVLQKAVQVLSILVGDDKDRRPQVFVKKDGKMQEIIIV